MLTDGGVMLVAAGALVGARSKGHTAAVTAGAGGVALALSVPLQFVADGHPSRAVWWFNARLAR
jgi:hypothetical protein